MLINIASQAELAELLSEETGSELTSPTADSTTVAAPCKPGEIMNEMVFLSEFPQNLRPITNKDTPELVATANEDNK